jgi:hypothetical protein
MAAAQHHGINRTLKKLVRSVESGNYYEAHQMYRTIANRHMKAKQYNDAISLLYSGSLQLLKHKQTGSGADLALYLVEAYNSAGVAVDAESLGRIVDILDIFPPEESQRIPYIKASVAWTQKHGEFPGGDPELHHYIGSVLWNEQNHPVAEQHFLAGTPSSATSLGHLEYEWATINDAPDKGLYLVRAVLQYLAQKHIYDAHLALSAFLDDFRSDPTAPELHNLPFKAAPADLPIQVLVAKQGAPMVNFCQLLVWTCQRDAKDLFVRLKESYKGVWSEQKDFAELLNSIGEVFFAIPKPKPQANPLADLMSSLFAGPSPSASSGTGARKAVKGSGTGGVDLD